jgi:hypothetical protein
MLLLWVLTHRIALEPAQRSVPGMSLPVHLVAELVAQGGKPAELIEG